MNKIIEEIKEFFQFIYYFFIGKTILKIFIGAFIVMLLFQVNETIGTIVFIPMMIYLTIKAYESLGRLFSDDDS